MPFDVEKARKDGASDDQILQYLTQSRSFDVDRAIKDGASKNDIIGYLATSKDSTANTLTVSERATKRLDSMRRGPAKQQFEQAQASADSDIAGMRAKSDAALQMLPFVLAAPFTGGLSLAGSSAIMGGAGLAAAGGQEIREAQRGISKPGSSILASLGLGVGSGVTAELGGALVAEGVGWGMTALPKLIQRSAAMTEKGARQLNDAFVATRQALYAEVGNRPVDIGKELREAYKRLEALPVGKAAFGEEFSELTPRAATVSSKIESGLNAEQKAAKLNKALTVARARQTKLESVTSGARAADEISQRGREIIAELEGQLEHVNTQISSSQPLDALIRIKGRLNQLANKEPSLDTEEAKILQDFTGKLDFKIRQAIRGDPRGSGNTRALALYDQANELMKVQKERDLTIGLAEKVLKKTIGFMAGPFNTFAASTALPHLSTMALEKVLTNKIAVQTWQKALALQAKGMAGAATEMATRAFKEAGVRESLRNSMKLVSPDQMRQPAQP